MAQSDDIQNKRTEISGTPDLLKDVGNVLFTGLKGLASLKITVGAFAFAIFLILAGTLAQVELDIHVVLKEYFRPWIVRIPLQVFLPVTFFPSKPQIGGWFWFPGGALIGTVMFVNLTAAHAVRFKMQARGARLWGGIGVIALGALVTYMVIASGSNKDGFQNEKIIEWNTLWQILKFGLGLAWVALASALLKIDAKRKLERGAIIALTLLLGAGVVYLFYKGDDAQLKDESMRILWQLIKAESAALLLLGGCIMVFKKRAGIVLLHAGVGLLMFSELLVAKTAVEAQMQIREGETAYFVQDARSSELAIVDTSNEEFDDVTVVPSSRLRNAADAETVLEDDKLPFKIRVKKYLVNSDADHFNEPNFNTPATKGGGLHTKIIELPSSTGTDSDQKFDAPSAYIEFLDKKSSKSLGVFLVSIHLLEQTVHVGDKSYEVALRFKRHYKSYSMHLIDVRSDTYLGTNIPRNYSSLIQLVDTKGEAKDSPPRQVKIWMNNPLRYAGETFYQSNYFPPSPAVESARDPETGDKIGVQVRKLVNGRPILTEATTLQVVTNTGWMIPYVACMIVATGLLSHFWLILLRFLNRRLTLETQKTRSFSWSDWRIPAVIIGVFGLWILGKMYPRSAKPDEMDLNAFGKLPVVANARMKPMDSVARNSLRSLSARQTYRNPDEENLSFIKMAFTKKRPAIRWFLDVVTENKNAEAYRVFRIDNLDVLAMLGLSRRPGYRYSLREIMTGTRDNLRKIQEQNEKAREIPGKERSVFQRKVMALGNALNQYDSMQRAFVIPPSDLEDADDELRQFLIRYRKPRASVPLATPHVDDEVDPWQMLANSSGRLWIRRYAKANGLKSLDEVATRLAFNRNGTAPDADVATAWKTFMAMAVKERSGSVSTAEIAERVEVVWARMSPAQRLGETKHYMTERLSKVMQRDALDADDPPEVVALVDILTAYRDDDVEAFNAGVAKYRDILDGLEPEEYEPAKLRFESWMNHFEPFYHAAILYLLAFIFGVASWLGWRNPLNRSALGLVIMAFVIHTFSLIARMYISGRWGVTVTNLYSSAIFIGWAACLLGIVLEVVHRSGIGTVVAGSTGFGALLIAHFLSLDGDTIAVMQAVLDTNFWLATHVTTITLGYATTYIAGFLGIVYIVLGLFTNQLSVDRPHPLLVPTAAKAIMKYKGGTLGQTLLRMIYGTLCFAIFFSFVGTVLGGLWADDSWGRFWGWDPKENGALIIVLWNALVLHARWGGMVKDRGLAVLAVGGNIVTSWSWFGVNLLGVGLHSYGFQEGVGLALVLFCASQTAIIGLGCAPREMWQSFRDGATTEESAA